MNQKIIVFKGHTGPINHLEIIADNRRIATCSHDSTIRVWDIDTGCCLHLLEGHLEMIESIILHPDNQRIISSSRDRTIRIWDIDSGKCLSIIEMSPKRSPDDWIADKYELHPDGKRLITWNTYGFRIKVWNIDTHECLLLLEHNEYVREIILHPDGQSLISWVEFGDEDSVFIWDLQTGKCLQSLNEYINTVEGVRLCPDGRQLLIWSRSPDFDDEYPPQDPRGLIWDLEAKKAVYLNGHKYLIRWIMPHPDGQRVVSVSDKVRIWDKEGNCLHTLDHKKGIGFVEFHPDGRRLVVSSGENVYIWNIDNGTNEKVLSGDSVKVYYGYFVPHSNNQIIVTQCENNIICVWNIEEGIRLHTFVHQGTTLNIIIHPNGKHMITGEYDLRLWDLETGECLDVMKVHTGYIYNFMFHPDGKRVISWSSDGTACVWTFQVSE